MARIIASMEHHLVGAGAGRMSPQEVAMVLDDHPLSVDGQVDGGPVTLYRDEDGDGARGEGEPAVCGTPVTVQSEDVDVVDVVDGACERRADQPGSGPAEVGS